jgi:hypothetical protein
MRGLDIAAVMFLNISLSIGRFKSGSLLTLVVLRFFLLIACAAAIVALGGLLLGRVIRVLASMSCVSRRFGASELAARIAGLLGGRSLPAALAIGLRQVGSTPIGFGGVRHR